MKKNAYLILLIFLLFVLLLPTGKAFSWQPQPLEIEYPWVSAPDGVVPPSSSATSIPDYFRYIFYFVLGLGGITALGVLLWAGFNYLTSAGVPEKMSEAKEQIKAAMIGLVILLGSVLILIVVNPNLVIFWLPDLASNISDLPSGVYICKEKVDCVAAAWKLRKDALTMTPKQIKDQDIQNKINNCLNSINELCYIVSSKGEIKEDFDNIGKRAWLVPPISQTQRYGAILYEETKFGGKNQVIYKLAYEPATYDIEALNASSIKPFILKNELSPLWYVEIFEELDQKTHNVVGIEKKHEKYSVPFQGKTYALDPPFFHVNSPKKQDYQFQSVKTEGPLIAIFFRNMECGGEWTPVTEIYALIHQDDNRLHDNYPIGQWCGLDPIVLAINLFIPDYYACATCMVLIAGGVY